MLVARSKEVLCCKLRRYNLVCTITMQGAVLSCVEDDYDFVAVKMPTTQTT